MSDQKLEDILRAIDANAELWSDFTALCDCGGRCAGTVSEARALELAEQRLAAIGSRVHAQTVSYAGWRLTDAALTIEGGGTLVCNPLLGSLATPPEGLSAEVCDLGRGAPEDFERNAGTIRGRFVVVRHEHPFSPYHVHRRRKLAWATERGAVGFIIANPHPGSGPVSGSSGRAGGPGIPAVGTDFESANRLSTLSAAGARVHLRVAAEDYAAQTAVLILDLPGKHDEWVVLSAHLDGHDLAESAMDNATGVAAALAVARACAPYVAHCARGLRVCLFSAEEWALAGSKEYLDTMQARARETISLNVNLDTVAGDRRLTALTSEFPRLDAFLRKIAREERIDLETYLPTMANSDHYNFARNGIPALRLVAGFDRPESNVRDILTRGDTRDKVEKADLAAAARTAAVLVWYGLTLSGEQLAALRER